MQEDKKIDMESYLNSVTRESEDYQEKSSSIFSNVESSDNDLWSEEVKAFADMQTIESLFFSEDWVFIVVDLICQKISSQPLLVYSVIDQEGSKTYEPNEQHELNSLLKRPNEYQDYSSFMYNLVSQYILLGNSIIWKSPRLKEMVTLRTSQIMIDFDSENKIRKYVLFGNDDEFQTRALSEFDPKDIIHIRKPNPSSLVWGLSPFIAGRKSILFNRYSSDYLNSFYLKQATPGMIVEMDRQVNEQQALRQLRTFEMAYTGRRNQRRTMILPKGVKASPSSHSIADQRITELINGNRENILALLKVPKHEVGLQTAGSLGSEEYKTSLSNFWESTLKPTIRMIEGSLNNFFRSKLGDNNKLMFDLSSVEALQDNLFAKAETAEKMLASGYSINEVRKLIHKLPAFEDESADKPYLLIGNSQALNPFSLSAPISEKKEEPSSIEEGKKEKLISIVNNISPSWVKSIQDETEELSEGQDTKEFAEFSATILAYMGKMAANIVKKKLVEKKDASIPSKKELKEAILSSFSRLESEWESGYNDSLSDKIEIGYDQQLRLVINEQDRDKIEALKVEGLEESRAILQARGLETFAGMSETQTNAIMNQILKDVENKLPIDEVSNNVLSMFGNNAAMRGRANTIARTETLTASSLGQASALKEAAKVIKGLKKGWLDVGDSRVRDSHSMVNGEVVDHDEEFSNGLRWPRDVRSRYASEVINCRCTLVMIPPKD